LKWRLVKKNAILVPSVASRSDTPVSRGMVGLLKAATVSLTSTPAGAKT
jgi:hypothetical protein